jgi:putative transport protein
MKPVLLAIVVCVTGLLTAIAVAKMLGLDPGFAAGLLSGSLTESPAMGTATEAINALPLPEADRAAFVAHIAVADAVCYIFGAVGVILFCSVVGPKLLGIDLDCRGAETGKRARDHPHGCRGRLGLAQIRTARLPDRGNAPIVGMSMIDADETIVSRAQAFHSARAKGGR